MRKQRLLHTCMRAFRESSCCCGCNNASAWWPDTPEWLALTFSFFSFFASELNKYAETIMSGWVFLGDSEGGEHTVTPQTFRATAVITKIVILWTTLFSALQCEPYTLSSANTRQNCAATGNGSYSCSFTCQSGYAFYEDYSAETFTTTCDPGQPWSPSYIPSCVRECRLLLWLKITFFPGSISAGCCSD